MAERALKLTNINLKNNELSSLQKDMTAQQEEMSLLEKQVREIETIIDQLYSVISDSTKYEELSNYSRDCTKPYLWKEWSSWYVKM